MSENGSRVDVYVHTAQNEKKLDRILRLLEEIAKKESKIMAAITLDYSKILESVEKNNSEIDSMKELLGNLSQLIKDGAANAQTLQEAQAKMNELADTIAAKDAEATAAVLANTPASP